MTPSLFNVIVVVVCGAAYGLMLPVTTRAAVGTVLVAALLLGLAIGVRTWASFTSPTLMDAVLLTPDAGFEAQPISAAYACVVGLVTLALRRIFRRAT